MAQTYTKEKIDELLGDVLPEHEATDEGKYLKVGESGLEWAEAKSGGRVAEFTVSLSAWQTLASFTAEANGMYSQPWTWLFSSANIPEGLADAFADGSVTMIKFIHPTYATASFTFTRTSRDIFSRSGYVYDYSNYGPRITVIEFSQNAVQIRYGGVVVKNSIDPNSTYTRWQGKPFMFGPNCFASPLDSIGPTLTSEQKTALRNLIEGNTSAGFSVTISSSGNTRNRYSITDRIDVDDGTQRIILKRIGDKTGVNGTRFSYSEVPGVTLYAIYYSGTLTFSNEVSPRINIRPSYYIEVKKPNATSPNNYDIFRILARKDMIDEGLTAMGTTMDQVVSNWSAIRTTDNAFVMLQKGILAAILSRGYCVFSEETDGHITDNVSVDSLNVIIEGTSFMSITSHAWLDDSTFTAKKVTSIYQYMD